MYRSATYLALQNGLTEENVPEILDQLSQHPISFGKAADGSPKVYVGDVDITHPPVIIKLQITSLGSGYSRSTSRTRFTATAYCSGRWYHHGWS